MNFKYILVVFFVLSTLSRKQTYAQDSTPFADQNVDDLGDVSDGFQEAFFEALKQKGIENYDRAVEQLNKCIKLDISSAHPILYFERGKNQLLLKEYDLAEADFLKTLELKPNQEPVLALLYDLYYEKRDTEKAETTLKQLIPFDSQYKEDLARLYTSERRYEEALALLDELDEEKGKDAFRDGLRKRIDKFTGKLSRPTVAIENNLDKNASENDYLKLIYLYSEEGNTEKAYEIAQKLEKVNPQADAVQLALYKIELGKGNTVQAIDAMTKVLASRKINAKAKHRVLNDFMLFVNENPSYQPQLESAIASFDKQVADANIYEKLSEYYIKKGQVSKALPYLQKAYAKNPNDINLLKSLLDVELQEGLNDAVITKASEALELYPSQASLYLSLGTAYNNIGKSKEAIDQLEIGVDYVLDDPKMEIAFYEQLAKSYTNTGDAVKAQRYKTQFEKLKAGM